MNRKVIWSVIALVALLLFTWVVYDGNSNNGVIYTSQQQVESATEFQQLTKEQVKEVKHDVAVSKKPDQIVKTTVGELPKVVEQNTKDYDFTIVTDPNNPTEKFDTSKYKFDQAINVNQYNIKAYKKHIRGIEYYPDKYVGADYSWKISDNGQYLGIAFLQNLDDNKTYLGVRYSW